MTSVHLNYLFKSPVSKYSHVPRCWEVVIQHMIYKGDTIQLLTVDNLIYSS